MTAYLFTKVFARSIPASGKTRWLSADKKRSGSGQYHGIHAVAAAAVLRLTARQRCSRMTIVTPYTHTMTAGMTTNR